MAEIGRVLMIFGAALVILGLILTFAGKIPWLWRLPGDIYIQKKNLTFYFPITTGILFSLLAAIIMLLLRKK